MALVWQQPESHLCHATTYTNKVPIATYASHPRTEIGSGLNTYEIKHNVGAEPIREILDAPDRVLIGLEHVIGTNFSLQLEVRLRNLQRHHR